MKKYLILLLIPTLIRISFAEKIEFQGENYQEMQKYADELFKNNKTKNVKNKWLKRWLWNNRFDVNQNGYVQNFDNLFENNVQHKKNDLILSQNSWIPLGPISIPPSYESRSCYSMGRVNCIAFHPKNKDIMWIGTPGGGIWKSINGGKSWTPKTDNLSSLAFSHIAVQPANPNILYAAAGDFDINSGSSNGIFKSTDGGDTWFLTGLYKNVDFQSSTIRKIIINYDNTNEIIAAGRRGIWKSSDAGDNWITVIDSVITDLEVNPNDSRILYASTGQDYSGGSVSIIKSTDFGNTWKFMETGMPPTGEISRVDIAISPANPNYIYALAVFSLTNSFHSFYKSTDNGNSWSMASVLDTNNNILGAWGGDASDTYGQGSYDLVLLADPKDKDKVYTGGINMWMSDDGGKNWEMSSFWIYAFGPSIHADHHFADYNPLDQNFYWCNDGGVYRTKEIKKGSKDWVNQWIDRNLEKAKPGAPEFKFPTEWENLSDGLAITEFYKLTLMKDKDNVLAAGAQDNSCYYYNSGNWLNYIPNYDGMETMIDNSDPDIFYGVWQFGGLCRTKDAGKTLTAYLGDQTGESGLWVTPVAMDPKKSNEIYIGYRNLWKSTDYGDNWTKLIDFSSDLFKSNNGRQLAIVKTSYSNSDYLCCYKESTYFQDSNKAWVRTPGQLWITKNNGLNWTKSFDGLPLDSLDIISLEYDREDPKTMWCSFYYWGNNKINLYKTTNSGENWLDISKTMSNGLRIRSVIHQQGDRDLIYAGTNKGVYYTDNQMTEWQPLMDNLPNCIVNDLEINPRTNELYAGTYGRGVWKTNLLVNDIKEISKNNSISVFPNPAQETINLTINENNDGNSAKLSIIDIRGIEVFSQKIEITDFPFNKSINFDLENGVYFIKLEFSKNKYYSKLIINK